MSPAIFYLLSFLSLFFFFLFLSLFFFLFLSLLFVALFFFLSAGWLCQAQRGFYDYRGEKPVPTR